MPLEKTYEKRKTRRFYLPIIALDPHDGGDWDLLISPKTIQWAVDGGMGCAKELAETVRWGLANPNAVYLGVRDWEKDISEDDWYCYVATPPFAYNFQTGKPVRPAWENEVFLIYVNAERVYYLSYWAKCDPTDGSLPLGHEDRFRERVWSK